MLTLHVIEGHNKVRIATVQRKGIRYRGRFHLPVSMDRLDGGATDPAGSLGSAALGAMAFGAAGAIVGSIAGRRGRTSVTIKTIEGAEMVCTVPSDEFPRLYVEVQRLIALAATGYTPENEHQITFAQLIFGPFYFLRFNIGWFLLAISLTVFTFGLAWPLLPFLARTLERQRAHKAHPSEPPTKNSTPLSGEFARVESDLLPAQKQRPPTP